MPAPPFRTRSNSWPFQNVTAGDSQMPHIIVKIAPTMSCVPVPLRMALTWNIFTKTLSRLYTVLQSNNNQFSEYISVTTFNETTVKIFREDTYAEITSEQWARAIQPDMVFILEFVNPTLPLSSGLELKSTPSSRKRASHLQLSFIPSLKGLEKHPGFSSPGSPSLRSPTLPSINELSSAVDATPLGHRNVPRRAYYQPICGEDYTQRGRRTISAHMMVDTSDDEDNKYPPSSASPRLLQEKKYDDFHFGLPHEVRSMSSRRTSNLEPEARSLSEADEYDREEEDGSDSYSNDSFMWGSDDMEDVDMEMDNSDHMHFSQESCSNRFDILNQPLVPKYRTLSENLEHNNQSFYPSSNESSASDVPLLLIDNMSRVSRWDRVQDRGATLTTLPTARLARTLAPPPTGVCKRKRGCDEDDCDMEATNTIKRPYLGFTKKI